MTSEIQSKTEKVSCSVCGRTLDPSKPLETAHGDPDPDRRDGFSCVDCWLRELRTITAEPLLARTLDRVLTE